MYASLSALPKSIERLRRAAATIQRRQVALRHARITRHKSLSGCLLSLFVLGDGGAMSPAPVAPHASQTLVGDEINAAAVPLGTF